MRPLRESFAKGDVLAGHLVDQDDEIVGSQAGLLYDEPVQRGAVIGRAREIETVRRILLRDDDYTVL